ncbi:MAG TPA: hypothetical protein VN924_31470 [Bryobacteraceae bacterium]|jgi:hypothetical protein|nr:hypothetical protein [Bryobacteraceae bacterium]
MKRQSGIELRIEELALSAMPPGGERRLRESIERELGRMLGRPGSAALLRRDSVPASIPGGKAVARRPSPETAGEDIAAGIHKGLMRT